MGLTLGGHRQENAFWEQTLRALAAHYGEEAEVDTRVVRRPAAPVGQGGQHPPQRGDPIERLHDDGAPEAPAPRSYWGILSTWPGKMRSGSLTTCSLAWWMRGHLEASP